MACDIGNDGGMVPELHIGKVHRGMYEARLTGSGVEITESTLHDTIAAAIKGIGESFPPDISEFLEIRYVDISIGVHSLARMKTEASGLADHLVELAATVWQSEEERDARLSVGR